jgi:hypothetical protein
MQFYVVFQTHCPVSCSDSLPLSFENQLKLRLDFGCSLPVAGEPAKASAEPAWQISGFFILNTLNFFSHSAVEVTLRLNNPSM